MKREAIAVIGIGLKVSGADDIVSLHRILSEREDRIHNVSDERRKLLKLSPDKEYLPASYVDGIEYFDPAYFGISSAEADNMDPQQRLALMMTCSALEDAGYAPEKVRGTNTAVNISVFENGFGTFNHSSDSNSFINADPSMLVGRICYCLDLRGPSSAVNTACSSSLYSVYQSCRQLENGEADLAVAGGVNINIIIPDLESVKSYNLKIASSDGHTRCFDEASDGSGLGEGAGVVILKRLDDAERDRDNIYAVIRACSVNHDGGLSNTISSPSPEAQSRLIESAIENSGADAEKIRFIECHGTGTKIGDPIEIKGLASAFGKFTDKKGFCAVTGIKSNYGHMNMAAGIAGFIKAVISLRNNIIYPMANFKKPNPLINFDETALYPCAEPVKMDPAEENYGGVSAFGLSGTNVHIILENYIQKRAESRAQIAYPFVISGKTEAACRRNCENIRRYIMAAPDIDIGDVSFTLCCGRDRNEYIYAFTAATVDECAEKLAEPEITVRSPASSKGIIFAAADHPVPDSTLYAELEKCPAFRSEYENITRSADISDERVRLAAVQTAFGRTLIRCGIEPEMVIGCGASNGAVALLSGKGSDEELPELVRRFGSMEFDRDNFSRAVKEKLSGYEFISIFGKNRLSEVISETCGEEKLMYAGGSVADCLCRAEYMGSSVDYEGFFRGAEVRRVPLPTYSFEKQTCWPKLCAQPGAVYTAETEADEVPEIDIGETETERSLAVIWSRVLGTADFDTDDDFFGLGGNSLMSMQLLNGIRDYTGAEIEFDDLYDYSTISELAEYIDQLAAEKNETVIKEESIITDENTEYPVSYQQESMMIIFDRDRGSVLYNVPYSFRFSGDIDPSLLVRAMHETVRKNNILHTVYSVGENGYTQRVINDYAFSVEIVDISQVGDKVTAMGEYLQKMGEQPFDLEKEIPIRAAFMKEDDRTYTLLMQIHHIAVDGWSSGLIVRDLFGCYDILKRDSDAVIPPARDQYLSYVYKSRELLGSESGSVKKKFWTDLLSECPESSRFNFAGTSQAQEEKTPIRFRINSESYEKIKKYCLDERVSLFTYLITVYSILFNKYTSQTKVCFGTAFANRTSVSYENMVGYFVNTLPMLFRLSGDTNISSLIHSSNRTFMDMLANQEVPFEVITSEMRKNGNAVKSDIFSNLFVLQNTATVRFGDESKEDFSVSVLDLTPMSAKFDTVMSMGDEDGELGGMLEYDPSFMSRDDAQRLTQHFSRLITDIAGNEDKTVSEADMLDEAERKNIYASFEEDNDYDF